MEHRLHLGLQVHSRHRLGDTVRHRWHPEHAHPTSRLLRYLHRPHRGWEVASGAHPVPELVQVVPQALLKLLEGLPVHSRLSLVGLDPAVCLPYHLLRDRKWFRSRLGPRFLLHRQLPAGQARMARPLRSTRITRLLRYYGTVRRCLPRYGTRLLADLAAWSTPSRARLSHRPPRSQCRGRSFPRSTPSPEPGSRRLYAGCRLGSKQVPPRLVPSRSASSVPTSLEVPLDASPAVHSRSPSRLAPDALLERLFRNVHHPGHCAGAACGSLEPPPARRFRGAHPHRGRSIASGCPIYIGLPSTFVAQIF